MRLEGKLQKAMDLLLEAPELDAPLRQKVAQIEQERRALESEIQVLGAGGDSPPMKQQGGPTPEEVARLLEDFEHVFTHGTWEERRDFIRCFVEGARVVPEKRQVELRFFRLPRGAHSHALGCVSS